MTKYRAAAASHAVSHGAAAAPIGHVPSYVLWAISFLTPILVACVNHIMVILDVNMISWKFENAKDLLESSGLALGTIALIGMCALFGSTAAILVAVFAPTCAGSGIPEVLGFLNGNELPGLFSLRNSIVRVLAIVLAQAAGFPIGREGPMIAIGGSIGFGVAHMFLQPHEQRSEKVISRVDDLTGETYLATSSLIANQERFAGVRRIGCALGAASGIATAFNAPIGGILYMYEEASVSGLMPKFHIFTGTVISSFVARALLKVTKMDVHRLVIYEDSYLNQGQSWDWADIPVIVLLAALLGAAGGFTANACCKVWKFRAGNAKKLIRCQPYAKLCECIFWCALCACLFSVMPALLACTDDGIKHAKESGTVEDHHRRLESSLSLVRYNCPEGQHNQAATLLLQGAEGAVKHLYSHAETVQNAGPLITTLVTYGILALGMPGLCVPMGLFIPNMLMGGLAGRLVGEIVTTIFNAWGIVSMPAGVYAVVGSAAMLAGFTHMTLGIVALLTEAIHDLSLIMPLMMVVSIARFVSTFVAHHGYDEQIIIKKGVPFLDTEIPQEMDDSNLKARDVCYIPPKEMLLPRRAKVRTIKRALRHHETNYFPIVSEDGHCVGLTNRGRLKAVLKAVKDVSSSHIAIVPNIVPSMIDGGISSDGRNCTHEGLSYRRPSTSSECSDATASESVLSALSVQQRPCEMGPRRSEGRMLGDQQVESRMRDAIMDLFANPEKLHVPGGDDDEAHDENLLPIERVMDPAPYMISEAMPIQRFYSLFNDVSVNVVCVLSSRGTFLGIITRRGLIDVASRLHDAHAKVPSTNNSVQHFTGVQEEKDVEVQLDPLTCTNPGPIGFPAPEEARINPFFKHISPGSITTPSETDAGSSFVSDDDTGDDESQHTPRVQYPDIMPGVSHRKPSVHSLASDHSATSGCSGTAMTMADMLGPAELRAQLALAWSRLAASEQEKENLCKRLGRLEQPEKLQGHHEMTMQAGGREQEAEHEEEEQVEGEQEEEQDEEQEEEQEEKQEEKEQEGHERSQDQQEEQEKQENEHQEKGLEAEHGQAEEVKMEAQKAAEEDQR